MIEIMAKGFVLVDVPESCQECKIKPVTAYSCIVAHRDVYKYCIKGQKPDWCPIKMLSKDTEMQLFREGKM